MKLGAVLFCILFPLICFRDISIFAMFHGFGDLVIFAVLIVVLSNGIYQASQHGFPANITPFNSSIFLPFIGMAILVFEGMGILMPVLNQMKEKEKFGKALKIVFSILGCVKIFFGEICYLTYEHSEVLDENGGLITVLLPHHIAYEVLELLSIVPLIPSYVLIIYPAIEVLELWLSLDRIKNEKTRWWAGTIMRGCMSAIGVLGSWVLGDMWNSVYEIIEHYSVPQWHLFSQGCFIIKHVQQGKGDGYFHSLYRLL